MYLLHPEHTCSEKRTIRDAARMLSEVLIRHWNRCSISTITVSKNNLVETVLNFFASHFFLFYCIPKVQLILLFMEVIQKIYGSYGL